MLTNDEVIRWIEANLKVFRKGIEVIPPDHPKYGDCEIGIAFYEQLLTIYKTADNV